MTLPTFDFEKPVIEIQEELKKHQESYQKLVLKKKAADAKANAEREKPPTDFAPSDLKIEELGEGQFHYPDPAAGAAAKPPVPEPEAPPEEDLDPKLSQKIRDVEARLDQTRREVYEKLTPWQRVQIARHPARPHALDYIRRLITDWTELHGDRKFGDDQALVAGLGRFGDQPVAVLGQQKGTDLKDNIQRNFGMMHPEGYRKAMRVMKLAEKFQMPVLVFIDTPGAYPGIGAEERGQGEAIASNIMQMSMLRVPIICTVIGEGASGGALGIGIGDRLLMLKYAWYCVISPEGCASILWRDAAKAPQAADALKLTSDDLWNLQIIDEIVGEPLGGAHHDPLEAAEFLKDSLTRNLHDLAGLSIDTLLEKRFDKYRNVGESLMAKSG